MCCMEKKETGLEMQIRKAALSDIHQVADLVRSLAHYYLDEDREVLPDWFNNTLTDSAFSNRFIASDYHNYIAEIEGVIVGYIAIKTGCHLYHLFVSPDHHHQGIGKALWQFCIAELKITHCSVRSSLYAVPIYAKLGFRVTGDVAYKEGIGYQPMYYE